MNQPPTDPRQPPDAKQESRGVSADMSPAAVTRRLQICSDLSALCRKLGKASPVVVVRDDPEVARRSASTGPQDRGPTVPVDNSA